MKIERPSETTLFKAIYKKKEITPDFPLVESEEINPFFTKIRHEGVTIEDLNQVREWKNKLVDIRDNYEHGGEMWTMFNDELQRVIAFLEQDVFK